MSTFDTHGVDRRLFLSRAGGAMVALSGLTLLTGCGSGGGGATSEPIAVVPAPPPVAAPAPTPGPGSIANIALALEYLGGQYFAFAANGTGLAASMTAGVGTPGGATGARRAALNDPMIVRYVTQAAADKADAVAGLRQALGQKAAAQPAIDLSAGTSGAFSNAARNAGIAAGGAFDPYVDEVSFLLGGFLIQDVAAAAYRSIAWSGTVPEMDDVLRRNLGIATYHAGLIRTILAAKARSAGNVMPGMHGLCDFLARTDGSNGGDQSLTTTGSSANLIDSGGMAIPFLRSSDQVMRALYLSPSGAIGGFFPNGINGLPI